MLIEKNETRIEKLQRSDLYKIVKNYFLALKTFILQNHTILTQVKIITVL